MERNSPPQRDLVHSSLFIASAGIGETEGNTLLSLPCEILRLASHFQENVLTSIGLLLACISLKYLNTGNPLHDNAGAWHAFLVAISIALMASQKIKLASRNTNDVPITSNLTTPPIADIIPCCIFLISGFLAQFCLLYIIQPLLAWINLCFVLFLLHEILLHSSYYYQKAVEWLRGISSRVFNVLQSSYQKAVEWLRGISSQVFNIFQQIFRPPQPGRSSPQVSNDAPATAVL